MTQLTADDVLRKQFPQTKGKYATDDVDDFLDQVVASFTALENQVAELSAAAEAPTPEPAPQPEPSEPQPVPVPEHAAGLLALAVKMHDEHIAAARAQADDLIRNARETAQAQLGDLEGTRDALEAKIEELRRFEEQYRQGVREQLTALLEQVGGQESSASTGL